jgi:hypothetical protein
MGVSLLAFHLMKAWESVTEAFEGGNLFVSQRTWFSWAERQFAYPAGWITTWEERWSLSLNPGGKCRERSQMTIDGGRSKLLRLEGLLPGNDITRETSRDMVMPGPILEETAEPFQV